MDSILIVGGAGYIGSHMGALLHRKGLRVTVLDDLSTGYAAAAKFGELVNGDMGDEALVAGLHAHGHRDAAPTDRDRLPEDLVTRVREGDLIVCLGAGDITAWAAELPSRLEAVL